MNCCHIPKFYYLCHCLTKCFCNTSWQTRIYPKPKRPKMTSSIPSIMTSRKRCRPIWSITPTCSVERRCCCRVTIPSGAILPNRQQRIPECHSLDGRDDGQLGDLHRPECLCWVYRPDQHDAAFLGQGNQNVGF